MTPLKPRDLKFAAENNFNVLISGKAGCGKTSAVKATFDELGIKYKMFSASTMDPWIDLIGIPREVVRVEDGQKVMDFVRPEWMVNGDVEAIFLDEYNRAPIAVKNALMELIQFRTINGTPVPNLRMVWTAINPDEDDDKVKYDVQKLDPAQMDRFHLHLEMPYKPDFPYFESKYGSGLARAAVSWWTALPKKTQNVLSPRRLDYAIEIWQAGGPVRAVMPANANVSEFVDQMETAGYDGLLLRAKKAGTLTKFFSEEKNVSTYNTRSSKLSKFEALKSFTDYNKHFDPEFRNSQFNSLVGMWTDKSTSGANISHFIKSIENTNNPDLIDLLNKRAGTNARLNSVMNFTSIKFLPGGVIPESTLNLALSNAVGSTKFTSSLTNDLLKKDSLTEIDLYNFLVIASQYYLTSQTDKSVSNQVVSIFLALGLKTDITKLRELTRKVNNAYYPKEKQNLADAYVGPLFSYSTITSSITTTPTGIIRDALKQMCELKIPSLSNKAVADAQKYVVKLNTKA